MFAAALKILSGPPLPIAYRCVTWKGGLMVLFEGEYGWDGKKSDQKDPITWWPCSYNVKIIDLAKDRQNVIMIKPYLCIFSNTGEGFSMVTTPDRFARRICEEFSLEMEKVLWVEVDSENINDFEVISFSSSGRVGKTRFYTSLRRDPMEGEKKIIIDHLMNI